MGAIWFLIGFLTGAGFLYLLAFIFAVGRKTGRDEKGGDDS